MTQVIENWTLQGAGVFGTLVQKLKLAPIAVLIVFLGAGHLPSPLNAAPGGPTEFAAQSGGGFSAARLEELVAPVALYPDELLGVVLAASTYPLQIVQAARFLKQHEGDSKLKPDEEWDTSVLALVNYPEIIEKMNQDLEWTSALGDAVLNQEADVMDAVQAFREQVDSVGNLASNDKQVIIKEKEIIRIESADPEVIYVPSYQPTTVVTTYAAAAPLYYYSSPYPYYYSPGAAFFTGLFVGAAIGYGLNWGRRGYHRSSINVNVNRNVNINKRNVRTRDINRRGKGVKSNSWRSTKRAGGGRGGARPVDRSRKSGKRSGGRVGDRPGGKGKRKEGARPSTRPAGKTPKRSDRSNRQAKPGAKTPKRSDRARPQTKPAAKTPKRSNRAKTPAKTGTKQTRRSNSARTTKGNFGGYKSGQRASRNSNRGASSRGARRSSGGGRGGGRGGGGRGGGGGRR